MNKIELPNITLLGIDCLNIERLQEAMDISEKEINFGAVKLLSSLPTSDSRLVTIPHIGTIEDFSKFCITELYKYVKTDYVLLVQYDGFILNSDLWTDEFLKYDYIGAPISKKNSWGFNLQQSDQPWTVGNGGFSIRSKRFLELSAKLASENKIIKFHPEDVSLCVWYRNLFEQEGIIFAPVDLAMKFSVQEDYGAYDKPFGFHGCYGKNMDELKSKYLDFKFYRFLPKVRNKRLEKIKSVFKEITMEGHIYGSIARGDADELSDIDVWLTFKNEDFETILKNRFELYKEMGEIVHIVEPPQNAPINGIQSNVIYKTKVGLLVVDYNLCPLSTSFVTTESKKLFGEVELPNGIISINPIKVKVEESYRLDFFINFINGAIKKIIRENPNALEKMFMEYGYLSENYNIPTDPITNRSDTFSALEEVIIKTEKIANEKQKKTLIEILNFIKQFEDIN